MKKLVAVRRNNARHWVGDGFPVRSIFSYHDAAEQLSPFLLLDYAGPAEFTPTRERRGVGAHPHRGFETVTIVYAGEVAHRDSAGGGGTIGAGDVQWMTAGAGLVHEEFHSADYARRGGPFEMIQLWVNLPAEDKSTPPRYQGISTADIPRVQLPDDGGFLRVIAGDYLGHQGPATTFSPMNVWDLRLNVGATTELRLPAGHTAALFVLKGKLGIGAESVGPAELAIFEREGERLEFRALEESVVLVLSGLPLNEPVVGYGPFVMNTEEEIRQAFQDYQEGRMGQLVA